MKRLKRPLLVLVRLAPFAAAAIGVWITWNVISSSRYEESLRLFREAGLSASDRDPVSSPIPDSANAAPLYLEALERVAGSDVLLDSFTDLSDDVRTAVANADSVLQLLRDAAKRPHCAFGRNDNDDPTSRPALPAAGFLKLAKLQVARSLLRSEDGDTEAAVEDLRTVFHMSRSLHQEPQLLSQMVRLAISGIGLKALEVILPRCDSATEAAKRIELDIVRGAIARAMLGEVSLGVELELAALDSLDPSEFGDKTSLLYWTLRLGAITRPYVKSEIATYLDFLRRFSEALQKSYPVAIADTRKLEDQLQEDGGILLGTVMVRMAGLVESEAATVSKLALAPLAARCLDHRRRHGAYPKSLSEVAVGVDAIDPFSGKPFQLSEFPDGGVTLESPVEGGGTWRLPSAQSREENAEPRTTAGKAEE